MPPTSARATNKANAMVLSLDKHDKCSLIKRMPCKAAHNLSIWNCEFLCGSGKFYLCLSRQQPEAKTV